MNPATQQNHVFRKASCPWGEKAVKLLGDKDIAYEDHVFSSREEEEAFKESHHVSTTPQIFFGDENVGGYDDLAKRFNVKDSDQDEMLIVR